MKKTLKIIFIILLIAGFAIFLLWLLNPKYQDSSQNFLRTVREFIPFSGDGNNIGGELPEEEPGEEFFSGGEEVVEGKRSPTATLPDIEQVYGKPVAGFTVIGTSTPIVRVVERETGHIVDINTTTQEQVRRSNTTLPGIREAIFMSGGNKVILHYTEENSNIIETLIIEDVGEEEQTAGTYIDENIISLLPGGASELIYAIPNNVGSSIVSYSLSSKSKQTIANIPLKQITLLHATNSYIYLETKASYTSRGYLYRIPRGGGSLQKVGEGLTGFNSTLSEDANIIWSTHGGNASYSSTQNQETGDITTYNLKTVASKCTVSSSSIYCGVPNFYPTTMPDSWFMGLTDTEDTLWAIDTDTGDTSLITELSGTDVINPHITRGSFFFVNKKDGSVWIVRLEQL